MNTTVKVVLRPDPKNKKYGYVSIRTIQNRKPKYKSLGIKIPQRHWDSNSERVLPSLRNDYRNYNKIIADKLNELKENFNRIESLRNDTVEVIPYWENYIKSIQNPLTKQAHKNAFNKFKVYLENTKQEQIRIVFITPQLIEQYQSYLLKNGLQDLSAKGYLSFLKAIINKAITNQLVHFRVHPFISVKTKPTNRKKSKALTLSEVNQLQTARLPEAQDRYRSIFLFQMYAGGLRIKDLMLLKWEHLNVTEKGIYIQYKQSKTKKHIISKLSYKALKYLSIAFPNDIKNEVKITIEELQEKHGRIIEIKELSKLGEYDSEFYHEVQIKTKKGRRVFDKMKKTELQLHQLENEVEILTENLHNYISDYALLNQSENENSNPYIFSLTTIQLPENGYMTTKQKNKLIAVNQRINYNLKQIAEVLKIPKFTTHTARHTYAQLAVDLGANVHQLSTMLGHSSISVTQNYIASLHNSKLDGFNDAIANL